MSNSNVIGMTAKLIRTYSSQYDQQFLNKVGVITEDYGDAYQIKLNDTSLKLPVEFFEILEDEDSKLVLSLLCETDTTMKIAVEKVITDTEDPQHTDTTFLGILEVDEIKHKIKEYDDAKELENVYVVK